MTMTMTMTTTELDPLIKAFVKTLEEANIVTTNTTHDLTSTQFECQRIVMDSLDIEPGTVVNMSVWAFFKSDNPDMRVSNTGRFHTNEELAAILRDYRGSIQVVDACDLH